MNRMTGIILMIIGILIFGLGVGLYNSSKRQNNNNINGSDLEKLIEMAIADGILTANEQNLIKQKAIEQGKDHKEVIKEVKAKIANLTFDSETELIDINKKKGDDFEKFIIQKFNKKYFRVKEWAGDKYIKGIYAETTQHPDIILEFKLKQEIIEFAVECKWRQKFYKGGIEFANKEQFKRYKDFEKTRKIPVFIAIGIGGKANTPENLYILPLRKIDYNSIKFKDLKKYWKHTESKFFFDTKDEILK